LIVRADGSTRISDTYDDAVESLASSQHPSAYTVPSQAQQDATKEQNLPSRLSDQALRAAFASSGPTDPSASLPHGTEYVWMKTDGAGTLLDIVSGVA
jgi:hypothetical protein